MEPMKIPKLPDSREVLARVETPVRPAPPTTVPVYRTVYFQNLYDGRRK